MKHCSEIGCTGEVISNGLCSKHYLRFYRYGTTELQKCKSVRLLAEGLAYCSSCKQTKNITEFNKDKQTVTGFAKYCRTCNHTKSKNRYLNNKDKHKDATLKKVYGITLLEYHKMLVKQKHKCAICGILQDKNKKYFAVDHDHVTGEIRGILCERCNQGLGYFRDNIDILMNAITYLLRNNVHEPIADNSNITNVIQ